MENLVQKLRSRGIAVTPQRLTVLAVLENRRDHPSAEKIFQEVRRQLPAISFNTVYKTLEVLHQKGLVLKVNPLHEMARYDCCTSPHAHLICRGCHRIMDADWEPPQAFPPEALQGFFVEQQTLTLWGLCPDCQGQENRKED
ncbi:MAG: transcriptional repressor [Deltaproteobacteria bacterium]|nr:transcriptional repressor [Deltaproteobacteria bacterium]